MNDESERFENAMKYTKNKKTTKTPMSLRISSKRLSHNRVRLVKVLFSWLSNVFVNSKSSSSFLIRYIDFVYIVQNKIIKKIKKKFKQISSNVRPLLLGTESNKKPPCHTERINFECWTRYPVSIIWNYFFILIQTLIAFMYLKFYNIRLKHYMVEK